MVNKTAEILPTLSLCCSGEGLLSMQSCSSVKPKYSWGLLWLNLGFNDTFQVWFGSFRHLKVSQQHLWTKPNYKSFCCCGMILLAFGSIFHVPKNKWSQIFTGFQNFKSEENLGQSICLSLPQVWQCWFS